MLDCLMDSCGTGVYSARGANVRVHHGRFQRSGVGAHCTNGCSQLTLAQCFFVNCKTGILIDSKGTGFINDCPSERECKCGIEIRGPKRTIAGIRDTTITDCSVGIMVSFGKVDGIANNVRANGSVGSVGIRVCCDVTGNIDFMRCKINLHEDWSGVRCLVTRDGSLVQSESLRVIKQMAQYKLEEVTVFQIRRLKKARVGDVICWGCRKVEPQGVAFKKCGRCKRVCYCSRRCQVNDWKFHMGPCDAAKIDTVIPCLSKLNCDCKLSYQCRLHRSVERVKTTVAAHLNTCGHLVAIMGDFRDLIGRVAQVGDAYVSLTSYVAETHSFEVIPLLVPNEPVKPNGGCSVHVKDLTFYPAESFAIQYPDAMHYSANLLTPSGLGVVYDLTKCEFPASLLNEHGAWVISSSSRVVGAKTVPDVNGQVHPTTVIRNEVHIAVQQENSIVEFEDIFFELAGADKTVLKHNRCKYVVFRRCRFSSSMHGVDFTAGPDCQDGAEVNATFERCTFHKCKHGLFVGVNVNAVMLNCFSSDCTTGIFGGDSRVVAKHCGFHRNGCGAELLGLNSNWEFTNCTFINNKYGVDTSARATCVMKGCRIGSTSTGSCLQGIRVHGTRRTTMSVENCVIYKCDTGVMIESGNVDFTMLDSKIMTQNSHIVGVEVRFDTIGNIDFLNCEISSYEVWSGKKCFVTIDDRPVAPKSMRAIKQRIQECMGNPSLHQCRLLKKAGVGVVTCNGCGKVEPDGVHFKKCQPCYDIIYCSRACQKQDWMYHKSNCEKYS